MYRLNPFSERLHYTDLTKSELREYYARFLDALGERTLLLTNLVRSDDDYASWTADLTPGSLDTLHLWFVRNVQTRPKTPAEIYADELKTPPGIPIPPITLTDMTFSLASDIGMYAARMMTSLYPHLRWKLPLGSKSFIDYGQPVLEGFRGNVLLNPVRISTVVAWKIAYGEARPFQLRETFEVWRSNVQLPSDSHDSDSAQC
jgi:hypothetical protein